MHDQFMGARGQNPGSIGDPCRIVDDMLSHHFIPSGIMRTTIAPTAALQNDRQSGTDIPIGPPRSDTSFCPATVLECGKR